MMEILTCPACSKTYSSKTFFRYHYLVEHYSRGLPCGRCPKTFPDLVTRARHLYAHDRAQHSCNLCAEVCRSQLHLYVHVTVVHHYRGQPVCHVCKVKLSEDELVDHYSRTHAVYINCLREYAERFCSLHSMRTFPEEDWALDNMMALPIKKHQSGLVTIDYEPMNIAGVSSIPKGGLARNKAAALHDHVTTAKGISREETVYPRNDTIPLWQLDTLNPKHIIKPKSSYEWNQMNRNQSSTSDFCGLDQMCEKQWDRDFRFDRTIEIPFRELNAHDLVYEPKQTTPSGGSDLGGRIAQPSEISKAVDIYEVLSTDDGKEILRCLLCGLWYEDLDSLLADHRVIDSSINLFYD